MRRRTGTGPCVRAALLTVVLTACGGEREPGGEARVSTLLGRLEEAVVPAEAVDVGAPRSAHALESGWHPGEGGGAAGWRAWTRSVDASLWMVVDEPIDGILWVRAAPPAFLEDQTIDVRIGGASLGTQPMQSGMRWIAFPVRASQLTAGHQRVQLSAARIGSPAEAGAGADTRPLGMAVAWVLLAPRGAQPARRVAALRAGVEERRLEGGGLRLLAGDFASLSFSRETLLGVDLELAGGTLLAEVVERGTFEPIWHERSAAGGPRSVAADLSAHLGRALALNLAVPGTSEPVELRRADARTVARPWNVVLVIVDTLRADAVLDPHGEYETPALDALAEDGIVFPRAYAHAPMTLPSHTALFSSQLPNASGIVNNWQKVRADIPLVSDWLGRVGYDTRAVLSLGTLWNAEKGTSVDRGFSVYLTGPDDMAVAPFTQERLQRVVDALDPTSPFFLFAHFSDPHEPYNTRGNAPTYAELTLNGKPLASVRTSEMSIWKKQVVLAPGENTLEVDADHDFFAKHLYVRGPESKLDYSVTEGALRSKGRRLALALENPGSQPLSARLNLWLHDAPDPEEQRRRYREEVEYVDRSIGAFLEHLQGHGFYDDALVVFTSDHGEALGERGSWGHVETLKEEMIHVPLVIKPPAGHPAAAALRARSDSLVRHVDLVPTILDLLDVRALPGQMGASLFEDTERIIVSETHRPEARRDKICLRDERYKMIFVAADEESGAPERFEMYDLEEDPGELVNVFAEKRSERPEWEQLLRDLDLNYRATSGEVEMTPEALEKLQALGYMAHE